nr:protein toll [Leptinotarsa decemlineata]XP_023015591.1 protein toll [Leptinotarsa decemlineata]XP_023015592.1 protein toll [Leptinotarsa decemlineata]
MRVVEALLIFLLGNEFVSTSPNKCRKSEHCRCINTSEEYEYQCGLSNKDNVVIHAVLDKYIKIDCYSTEFNVNILPNYTAGNIEFFELRFCPLTQKDFSSVLEKFRIDNLENLHLEEITLWRNSSEETNPITKDFFQGLSSLRILDISMLDSTIDVEAFQNLSNLTNLYLENNYIQEIGGMFESSKYLKVLHLSRNAISHIPNGTFQNLVELQQLHLWKNNLTGITKYDFAGLNHLKSLELSRNYIQFIDNDGFSDLSELINISLRENQLGHINSSIFRQNGKLNSIRMDYNPNVTLDDYVFANLKNLSMVNLAQSGLRIIPEHVFEGSENIETLMLQNNFLQELPEGLLGGLKKLKQLNLSNNNISSIPDTLLSSLVDLEVLDLEGNLISEINDKIFKMTEKLKRLYLNNNRITTIMPNAFKNNKELIHIDLSNNLYDMKYDYMFEYNPFTTCKRLENLLLSGNLIDEFPSSIMYMVHLRKLDLSKNNIESITVTELKKVTSNELEVDLSSNKISTVNFKNSEHLAPDTVKEYDAMNSIEYPTTVLLSNNSLICDCRIYDLVQYLEDTFNPAVKAMVDLRIGDNNCAEPDLFQHIKIEDLRPKDISCKYPLKCETSSHCQCLYRPFDKSVVVDCSYRNLTECPRIDVDFSRVEMNLVGNMILYGPNASLGYDNVTNIFLSNNRIEQIKWVPPEIEVLKLDGNHLTHLNTDVLKMMNSSSILTLSNNPWTCDCSAFEFQNFIRGKFGKESRSIICKEDGKPLIEKIQLCEPIATLIMKIVIPIAVILVLTAIVFALYFQYEQEVKIWLYEKKLFLWLITEEELDKDKIWDVFISYAHQDEDFVVQNLLSVLEEGPNPFKTCIHIRDWGPCKTITDHISYSVNNSRRTLVVLSNNFLESVWGKMEFRAAHTKAIEEGRARVIVIKYGELDEDKVDDELKMYLKTNTYVEWGKPWFWRKLRYALPHSHIENIHRNQRHTNMMLKIDDKFELTTPPPIHPDSTPPVVSLDPSLLKSNPLNFQHSNNSETPPAEMPLVKTQ